MAVLDLDEAIEHSEAIAGARLADKSRTHTGNADRLVDQYGERFRYALGAWVSNRPGSVRRV